MSNSSGSVQLVETFGGSFFHWIATEVLPYVQGSVLALCVLIGIILNLSLLVVYVKRRLYHDPTNHFIPQMALADLAASFVVIIPSSVAAFMREWPLSDAMCEMHGMFVTWFHLLSFAMVILIFVERAVKAWNPALHNSTFNTHAFVVVVSVFVWAADLLVALLPSLGIGKHQYNKYQSQCSLKNEDYPTQTHAIFALGVYSSPLICFVVFVLLVEKRRRNIVHERNGEKNKLIDIHHSKGSGLGGKAVEGNNVPPSSTADAVVKNGPTNAWGKNTADDKAGRTPLFPKNLNNTKPGAPGKATGPVSKKTKREVFLERYNRRMSRPQSQTVLKRMFRDSQDEKDHHQAMTALITWFVLELCWVWTVVATMLVIYSKDDVWGGWHTIAVLLGDVTYCVKPIVYLAHNRHYRQASKETVPEAVRVKADNITRKMSEAVSKLDKALFKSPGATKANKFRSAMAAIAAQRALLIWKKKAAGGIGKFGFGKKAPAAIAEGSEKPALAKTGAADASKPGASLMGSTIAAAAMAQSEARKEDTATNRAKSPAPSRPLPVPALVLPPGTPTPNALSVPGSRQGTPGSLLSDRPATKASVILSMRTSTPGTPNAQTSPNTPSARSPNPPHTPGSAVGPGENDMAQLLNPFSPQI